MSHPFDDLYARIPAVACAGHCGRDRRQTCCGPIGCSTVEAEHLDGFMGIRSPWLESEPGNVVMDPTVLTLHICPHLGLDGRCVSYAVRPVICRIWGAVKALRCPWGCQPARWMSGDEARALFEEARRRSVDTFALAVAGAPLKP